MAKLSQALGAVAAAHDTPGFGLTARAGLWNADRYSLSNDAGERGGQGKGGVRCCACRREGRREE